MWNNSRVLKRVCTTQFYVTQFYLEETSLLFLSKSNIWHHVTLKNYLVKLEQAKARIQVSVFTAKSAQGYP